MWLGALAITLALNGFLTSSNSTIITSAIDIYDAVWIFVIFAFIDTTVRVARRSDPLLRSILRWEKIRIVFWGIVGVEAFSVALPGVDPALANNNISFAISSAVGIFDNVIFVLFFILLISSGSALVIGARRSGDPLLRASLKWLGVFLFLLVVAVFLAIAETTVFGVSQFDVYYSYPALISAPFILLGAYALHRSARSLAPINRIQAIEPTTISTSKVERS